MFLFGLNLVKELLSTNTGKIFSENGYLFRFSKQNDHRHGGQTDARVAAVERSGGAGERAALVLQSAPVDSVPVQNAA